MPQILIAESDCISRIRLERSLRGFGCKSTIMTATDLPQALGWIESKSAHRPGQVNPLPMEPTKLVLVTGCPLADKDFKLLAEVAIATTAPVWLVCGSMPSMAKLEMLDVIGVKVVPSEDLGDRMAEAGMLG